ncbi:kinase-like protein [Exidia glandulosa HHB12029]|uniref:Kinase-like protein n=1 Tax=Exidia glandulosa HHB12029 TaxID=1314781 RepID=A0A165K0Q3_EXIGL|nr:kinase-like protein [Exidia glandulosa HHB12029]
MPQSWAESLAAQGLSEAEIHQLQQRRIQQQQQLANGQPGGPISPVSSLNGHGRLIRAPERQGSLPMSEDPHSSSSYHSPNGSVIMPGLNGYFPSPVTNGHGSRPASPARRGGTPSSPLLSPGATRRAPSPLSQPSVVVARQDSDSPSSGGGRNGVAPRSPAYSEFSRDSSGSLALLSEPPSPAPVAISTVTTVAKRAVAKEIQSPASATASGRDSPASAGSGSGSPARVPGGPFSPVKGPLVNVVTSAASGSRPSTANSPVASRVQPPPSISRPSTAPTSALSPTAHRPPPLKLGLDVSSERLAVQLQRSPDPRDPRGQPAESPTTAILSQLVSQHLPPSPVKPSPSTARPSPQQPSASASRPPGAQHTRSASSISRKPVPPIVPPAPALQRQPSEDESPSALDEWLEGEEEADRIKDNEDEDVISAESVLDAWLNGNNADDSATSPAESPEQQQPSKPFPPASGPPPARPPPPPPRTALPATPGSARHDVPVLRVDTAAPPTASTPPQQRPFPHVTAAQAASLAPAPPAPWLQGSPSTDARPVYLPAELEPLRELIHLNTNARALFGELVLVAQGQYGDVYAVNNGGPPCALKIAPLYIAAPLTPASAATTSAASTPGHHTFDELGNLRAVKVSPKMAMLKHELVYIGRMRHEHVLGMDALYFVDDSLWIKMELMVRSLADLVGLCGELFGDKDGEEFTLREREVARFAADTLEALKYIEILGVAHRDVRSDNLLLNGQGVVKLADFSHAVKRIEGEAFVCRDIVGVAYWRAAEINTGPYDPMRVDVWSLGATVWELMEAEPPFERTKQLAHRWPPLERARGSSTALQDFLHWCSDPPSTRPSAAALLQTPWIKSACSRGQVVELLERARQLEESLALDADEEDEDS